MQNYYSLLEISETATQLEIKAAFKRLALLYHPDKHAGDEAMSEKFKEINQAYQTLSNSYSKARYDIQLTYGQNVYTHYEPPVYKRPPTQPRPHYRRKYSEPKIDWRENWIATGYAFAFTFVVATFVMIAIFIKNFYDEKKYEELLTKRRQAFELAKENYKLGNVDAALLKLNDLDPHLKEESDMADYTSEVYKSLVSQGEENFENQHFPEAIYYYELIERFAPRKPIPLKEHLAQAYKNNHQPEESIRMFEQLLVMGYRNLDCYVSIGEIYRDELHDLNEALRYFVLADQWAIRQYQAIWGKGYPFVLTATHLPKEHYTLYTNLAQLYLDLKMHEKAVKTTAWNIQIWPDSAINYFIAGKGLLELGQKSKACKNFDIALTLGYKDKHPNPCQQ
jgi:curved DNA-binding protein CbpA